MRMDTGIYSFYHQRFSLNYELWTVIVHWHFQRWINLYYVCILRGNLKEKKSISKDIIQIKVDHPPSYPNIDKLFFDKF